jgi:hypothetical protein
MHLCLGREGVDKLGLVAGHHAAHWLRDMGHGLRRAQLACKTCRRTEDEAQHEQLGTWAHSCFVGVCVCVCACGGGCASKRAARRAAVRAGALVVAKMCSVARWDVLARHQRRRRPLYHLRGQTLWSRLSHRTWGQPCRILGELSAFILYVLRRERANICCMRTQHPQALELPHADHHLKPTTTQLHTHAHSAAPTQARTPQHNGAPHRPRGTVPAGHAHRRPRTGARVRA